jgi:hypothetical protein
LALVTSGNAKAHNTSALQPINGPMGGPQEVHADNFSSSMLIRICLFHFILVISGLFYVFILISVTCLLVVLMTVLIILCGVFRI